MAKEKVAEGKSSITNDIYQTKPECQDVGVGFLKLGRLMIMEISRNWRLQQSRYRLIGTQCEKGHKSFPPREICPECTEENSNTETYDFDPVYVSLATSFLAIQRPVDSEKSSV